MVKCACSCVSCKTCFYIFGGILLVIGIILTSTKTAIINGALQLELQVIDGSYEFEAWQSTAEYPAYLSVWIWDYKNADNYTFTEPSGRFGSGVWTFPVPDVAEVGPFVYTEIIQHKDHDYVYTDGSIHAPNPDKQKASDLASIRSERVTNYYPAYDPNDPTTGLNPHEHYVNPMNLLAIGLPKIVDYVLAGVEVEGVKTLIVRKINDLMTASGTLPIVKNITAHQALWEYEDPILKELQKECEDGNLDIRSFECAKSPIADLEPYFGILISSNGTSGNFFQQNTGAKGGDLNKYLEIEKFSMTSKADLSDKLDWWLEEPRSCNDLRGTDGSSSFPFATEGEPIPLFSGDLFRSFDLQFTEKTRSPADKLDVYRYDADEFIFASPNKNPDNQCFCIPEFWDTTTMNCTTQLAGGMVTSRATLGLPLVLSLPHFLWGPEWQARSGGDFHPTVEQHGTWLEFEPTTGTPMVANKRIQQSLAIVRDDTYDIYKNMLQDTIVMPLVWVNESFIIEPQLEDDIYLGIVTLPTIILAVGGCCIAIGAVLIAAGFFRKDPKKCADASVGNVNDALDG